VRRLHGYTRTVSGGRTPLTCELAEGAGGYGKRVRTVVVTLAAVLLPLCCLACSGDSNGASSEPRRTADLFVQALLSEDRGDAAQYADPPSQRELSELRYWVAGDQLRTIASTRPGKCGHGLRCRPSSRWLVYVLRGDVVPDGQITADLDLRLDPSPDGWRVTWWEYGSGIAMRDEE
jgi:hypothetical protein